MAEGYLELSVAAVCDLIEAYTGNTTSGDALAYAKNGYKRFLMGVDPRTQRAHHWSFLRPLASLALTSKATGTATGVYSAVTELTTITATASIFYDWHVGSTITVTDVGDLTISAYTSATVVVADDGENFASKAISVQHPGIYNLPAGFGGLIGPPKYHYNSGYDSPRIQEATPEFIMDLWSQSNAQEDTLYYAVVPADPVTTTGTASGVWTLWVAPRSINDRTLSYRYVRLPLDITDSSSAYFLGGPMHNETIKAMALADAELGLNKSVGPHESRAAAMMAASIDLDSNLYQKTDAEQMRR
jgi:hypothetical protein